MGNKSFQINVDFIGNISDLLAKIKQATGEINKIGVTSGGAQVQKQFEQLIKTVTDLQTRVSQPISSKAEFNKLAGEVSKANMSYGQLMGTIERLQSLNGAKLLEFLPKDQQSKINKATNAIKQYEEAQKAANKAQTEATSGQKKKNKITGDLIVEEQRVEQLKEAWEEAKRKKEEYLNSKAKGNTKKTNQELWDELEAQKKTLESQRARLGAKKNLQSGSPEFQEWQRITQEIDKIQTKINNIKTNSLVRGAEDASKAYEKAQKTVVQLQTQLQNTKIPEDGTQKLEQAFIQLKERARELGVQVNDISDSSGVQTLLTRLNQLENDGFTDGAKAAQQYANTIRSILDPAFRQMEAGMRGVSQSWNQFSASQEDMSMLQSRLKYFFSTLNMFQLLKRTVRSAINTVKELDAVMTETAVVTDFSVGDMWDKLPEYSSKATALGASIKDLYSATTLYYQQGLKTNEAMGVGVETMKMARIAGLEASDATKYMTAALRGFNMEVNEMNAQHVNDVYSELAAITAADTSQIATAMSKTASIASSANMEFETTSALLAQIIETTQEAPETAGTAMKTIIARFTEVKELFSEGQLTGEDEEGEAININKIDKALKTVGISLKDFLNGSKGIDDIFLELASKWDTLDLSTQRYIATMAAGSRQQSRFIAMMSNYERTMELVSAANDSAGASQEQFNKTLDSMEAKTQKMKNAWNEFTMGLANNDILKAGVDLLSGFINIINKATDAISGGNGLVKSVLSLGTVIGGLKLGGAAVKKGLPKLFGIDAGGKVVRDKVNNPRVWDLISRRGVASGDTASQKRALKFDEIEHRQRMAWLQTEHGAELKAIEETKIAGIQAEAVEKKAALEGEYTEAQKATSGEYQERLKAIESEEAEKIAAVKGETEEAFYSSKYSTKAALGKKYFSGASGASLAAGGIGGLIGGAIGGSIIAEQFDKRTKTAAEALDDLADKADGLESALETTRDALEGIETVKSNLKDYSKQLKTLEKGSTEYYKTLSESNSTARELINSTLGQKALALSENRQDLYEYDKNGQLVIDESFYQLYEQAAQQQILQLENQQLRLESERAYYQTRQNLDESGIRTSNITDKEERATKGWTIGTGAAAGAGAGILTAALAGVSSGSLAGPIGAIVGLVAGLLVGTISAAVGAGVSQAGNKESDYFRLYKQLNKQGAEIEQSDIDLLKNNNYDLSASKDEMDPQLYTALMNLEAQIGPEAFASLIGSLDNNTAAIKENTGKWADNSQESFNARKQEFYNRLLALYPDVDPTKLEEQAGVLATQWSEDDLQREIDKAKNRQEYFGARGGKNSTQRDEWAAEVSSRASEAGMAVGNKGYVYHEDGQDYIWDATSNDYRELRKGEDAENAVLQKEAENQILDEIVSGVLTASFGQIGENIASEAEESYAYVAQQERIRQVEESGTLESRYKKFISSEEGQAFSNSDFALLLENYVSTSGEEQITALEKIIYAIQTSPGNDEQPLVDAMGAMGIDILGLIDETWASGLYDTSMGFDREKVGTEAGKTNLQDLTQVYTEDYLQGLRDQLENMLREQNEGLYDAISKVGIEPYGIMEEILSFDSKNIQDQFQGLFGLITSDAIEGLSDEQKQQLEEAMKDLDIDNMSSLEEFFTLLTNFGLIDFDTAEGFMNEIARFAGAIEEVGSMTSQQVNEINTALDKLRKGEALTNDELQNLIAQSPEIAGYFITTDDGKIYLSTGYSAGEVEGLVQSSVRQDLAGLGQTVEQGRRFEEALDSLGSVEEGIAQKILAGDTANIDESVSQMVMESILKKMGVNTEGFSYVDYRNNFKRLYGKYYGENGQTYEGNKAAYQGSIIASGTLEGLSETEATAEVVDATLTQLSTNLGVEAQSVLEYKNQLRELNPELTELGAGLAAENFARSTTIIKNIADNWDEWTAAIDEGQTALKQTGKASLEYYDAIGGLKKELGKLLKVESDLSDEFVLSAKNSGLLEKALQGNEKAIAQLRKEATKDVFKQFGEDGEEAFANIKEDIAALAEADVEVGMTVSLEDAETNALAEHITEIYNAAYNAARDGGAKINEAMQAAADAVNAQGYEVPKMVVKTYDLSETLPSGQQAIPGQAVPVGNGKTFRNFRIKSIPSDTVNYSITRLEPAEGTGYTKVENVNVGGNNFTSTGGGGGGSTKEWENPYDEFYNTTEQLNEHLREREKLERRYQRLLDQTNAKSENLVANIKEQLDSLKQEKDIREELLKNRERQMNDIETEYSDMRQYGYYDEKTQQIVIDWSKIEALDGSENEELTSRIEEYIGKLEEQQDLIEEEQDALEDINDAVWEIYQQGKDAYLSMENKIKEAIIADRQKEIDKLSDINDSINDTNSRLIDAMQSSVDKYRQDRENEKTEEELSDKQRRLAYLRQDTSGANALEIMQLQEELDEATEDYTDTLIDQKISELQEQNDKAAEQRQRQIELMQAQLDYYGESMLIWEEVNDLLLNGYDISKGLLQGSRLEELLRSAEGFEGMSQIEQMNWMKETNKELSEGFSWLKSGALQYLYGRGTTIEFKDKDGNVVSGVINDDGDVEVKDTQGKVTGVYSGESFAIDANKNITSSETMTQASERVTKPQPVQPSTPEVVDASGNISSLPGSTYLTNDQVKKLQQGLNELLADGKLSGFAKLQVDGLYGGLTAMAVGKLQAAIGTPVDGQWGPNTKRAFDSSHLKAYKTGGLADFTGPAWLDGTKSRPEYILNAEQTKSFFQLVDVLSGLNSDSAQSSQITGDSIYDIDINVESVNNDYDVEQMAEKIKRLINDDARYRNNNTINLQR